MEAGAQPLGALAVSKEQERGRIAQQEATGRPWGGVGVWVGLKAAGAEAGTQERGGEERRKARFFIFLFGYAWSRLWHTGSVPAARGV